MSSYIYVFVIKDKYKFAYYWDGCTFSLHVKIKSAIFDTAGEFFSGLTDVSIFKRNYFV